MLTNIQCSFLKVTNSRNVQDHHQCVANKLHLFHVVIAHILLERCISHFLASYPIRFYSSTPFLVLFPLSASHPPPHHLANSSNVPSNASSIMNPSLTLPVPSHPWPPPPSLLSQLLLPWLP